MAKSLAEVLFGGRKTKEFKLGESSSVVMQTLSGEDTRAADREVYLMFPNAGFSIETNAYRVPVLSRALVSVAGVPVQSYPEVMAALKGAEGRAPTLQQALAQILDQQDSEMLTAMYSLYLDLEKENREEKEKLRNFSQAQKEGSSGS